MNVPRCGRSEWAIYIGMASWYADELFRRTKMRLEWLRWTKRLTAALLLTVGATGVAAAQGYGYYPRHHDWHYGAHHDWHSGPHYGPHNRFHWDRRYGWHYGQHYGPHRGTHHDWHSGAHHNDY